MKQHSQLYKFFIGQRIPIDEDKLNYKELLYLKWNRFIRWFTNIFYFIIINAYFGLAWTNLNFKNDTFWSTLTTSSPAVLMGVGQVTSNLCHYLINKFSKEKTRKDLVKSGNPVPKRSNLGLAFMLIALIPIVLWLIGALIIKFKCRSYKYIHGSLERPEQRLSSELDINKKVLEHTTTAIGKVIKETLK